MPVLRSQTVYLSITVHVQQHTLLLSCVSASCLLSHVPCFVSASCRSYSHVPSFVSVLLSQVLCFVSASLPPFLLSLMCIIALLPFLFMCIALSQHHAALTLSQGITLLLLSHVPCFVLLSITQVLRLSITPLMCLALSQHDITLFSALLFPG